MGLPAYINSLARKESVHVQQARDQCMIPLKRCSNAKMYHRRECTDEQAFNVNTKPKLYSAVRVNSCYPTMRAGELTARDSGAMRTKYREQERQKCDKVWQNDHGERIAPLISLAPVQWSVLHPFAGGITSESGRTEFSYCTSAKGVPILPVLTSCFAWFRRPPSQKGKENRENRPCLKPHLRSTIACVIIFFCLYCICMNLWNTLRQENVFYNFCPLTPQKKTKRNAYASMRQSSGLNRKRMFHCFMLLRC